MSHNRDNPTTNPLADALNAIVAFKPDPNGDDPYMQIAVFAKRTARAALERAAAANPNRWQG